LANDDTLRARMSDKATERSMAFRAEVFDRGFREAAWEVLSTTARVTAR
jgi:hypothetical protein